MKSAFQIGSIQRNSSKIKEIYQKKNEIYFKNVFQFIFYQLQQPSQKLLKIENYVIRIIKFVYSTISLYNFQQFNLNWLIVKFCYTLLDNNRQYNFPYFTQQIVKFSIRCINYTQKNGEVQKINQSKIICNNIHFYLNNQNLAVQTIQLIVGQHKWKNSYSFQDQHWLHFKKQLYIFLFVKHFAQTQIVSIYRLL
ncbi:unnamed protein product (macronuclear) [Paramecium tetraurelia]|uniref:Transmembrane protein n=1 Tax=Paramecium tetraurelia TaxID=5888 RepID=A0E1Q6_PARTE|nr:uncharacterized protein GSPATT00022394001 [Paramecium tetraurelia]CAK89223.1 unnamed protein product [Paramecium tetraurelia]|eukprot:XP_001456620.1 hypothetical protein (macronuclear) [Paramecium tetraurelia strain d4-2]